MELEASLVPLAAGFLIFPCDLSLLQFVAVLLVFFFFLNIISNIGYCSLAASLLPQGATPVGFGGYMGCSRVDSSLTTEDSLPFLVLFNFAAHLCFTNIFTRTT